MPTSPSPYRSSRAMLRPLRVLALTLLGILAAAGPGAAQAATELGRQSLGRPYWHVFAAYAIVVVLIAGWVISIARRLARVESRLPDLES